MATSTNSKRPEALLRPIRDPVKLTALLYLQEALLAERYEECAEFIAVANEFGANAREVLNVLENPRRLIRG